jgi:hypothetical protein
MCRDHLFRTSSEAHVRIAIATLLAALVACGIASARAAEPATHTNVVLIMADDFGYECVRANGGESYHTPHLDRLAAEGIRFTRCHVQPLCTPTRLELMTGLSNVRNYHDFGPPVSGRRLCHRHLRQVATWPSPGPSRPLWLRRGPPLAAHASPSALRQSWPRAKRCGGRLQPRRVWPRPHQCVRLRLSLATS